MKKFAEKMSKESVKRLIANVFFPLLALSIALAIWAIYAAIKGRPFLYPPPASVLREFFLLWGSGKFWLDVLVTLGRTLECFAISFALALLFASLSGVCKTVHRMLSPIVSILRSAPTVAVILVLYVFFMKETLAIIVGALIAFPVLYSAFYSAIDGVDRDLISMAKLYKVRARDIIFGIYLPSIAGALFDASRSTLSLTLKVIISAEILTNVVKGVGGDIQLSFGAGDLVSLLALTIVAVVMSFVLEGIVLAIRKLWEVRR